MDNIQIFKALSGVVFAKAYDSFPLKITISPGDLALELGDEFWAASQRQLSENEHEYVRNRSPAGLAKPTVQWLVEAGFLSCESYRDGKFHDLTLTAKGLESIEADESRGQLLLRSFADLATDELKTQARSQLSKAFSEALSWSISNVPTIISGLSKAGVS